MKNTPENAPSAGFLRPPVAWAMLRQATVLATGNDAVRFVDNFVTASISSLPEGGGTESFVTDPRGHVIALVAILRTDTGLEIIAPPGLGERLRDHLEHYHIREAVELVDASDAHRALVVAGPEAATALAARAPNAAPLPSTDLGHAVFTVASHDVRVVRLTGQGDDGYLIRGPREAIDAIVQSLTAAGVPRVTDTDLEAARIAAGYPAAIDIDAKALPQELGRDARAISFTKGCYLGQETVARLDALGHVNRRLVILGIDSDHLPACPTPILHADDVVGTLTSCCVDASRGQAIGLGIVHTKALSAAALTIGTSPARILAVPPAHLERP
jgi:folate-binding protein YgfZ